MPTPPDADRPIDEVDEVPTPATDLDAVPFEVAEADLLDQLAEVGVDDDRDGGPDALDERADDLGRAEFEVDED